MAELEALHEGIRLCLKMGITKVIIEGDCQIVLNAVHNRSTPNWVLHSKLEEILFQLDKLEAYQITHILREGNQKADKLANLGADGLVIFKTYNPS